MVLLFNILCTFGIKAPSVFGFKYILYNALKITVCAFSAITGSFSNVSFRVTNFKIGEYQFRKKYKIHEF